MSERIQALAQVLTGKGSVEECTLEELEQLTLQYPYFAPAQFLLLQKLKLESSADCKAQQQKAILYYHDPLLFEEFVSTDKFFTDDHAVEKKEEVLVQEPVEAADESLRFDTNDVAREEQLAVSEDTPTKRNAIIITEDEKLSFEAFPQTSDKDDSEDNEFDELNTSFETEEPETIVTVPDDTEQKNELSTNDEEPTADALETTDVSPVREERNLPESNEQDFTMTPDSVSTGPGDSIEKFESKTTIPDKNESALLFEPYHTVDYFASQGIKVSAAEVPTDKLGKQLRSFTEWLKTMKRLPATEMTKAPETTAEKTVESMASHSVEESDVVTETMAEVWAKQGAREKAVETYNKLSLLNPSKRAYFAAKIENLK